MVQKSKNPDRTKQTIKTIEVQTKPVVTAELAKLNRPSGKVTPQLL